MRILSSESFTTIVALTRENYGNLHARLALKMKPQYAAVFSSFTNVTAANSGQWSVSRPDEQALIPLTQASPEQRAKVAIFLRDTAADLRRALGQQAAMADNLMHVPTEECVFFTQRPDGAVDPVLTQWGFRKVKTSTEGSVIEMLIAQAADMSSVDATITLRWSDGEPLAETDVTLNIFGSAVPKHTDSLGNIAAGQIIVGKSFSVTLADGTTSAELTATPGTNTYIIEFPRTATYSIEVRDTDDKILTGRDIVVNGTHVVTGPDGRYNSPAVKLTPGMRVGVSPSDEVAPTWFTLSVDSEKNIFTLIVESDRKPVPPPPPNPEPPKPQPLPLRLRVVDKKGNPIVNAAVKVRCVKGYLDTYTDSQGYVNSLTQNDLQDGEKPKVEVMLPRKSNRRSNKPLNS